MNIQSKLIRSGLALALPLGLAACGGQEELSERAQKAVQASTVVSTPSPAHELPDARELATGDLTLERVDDIRLAAARVRDARPDFYAAINALQPRETRNGMLRFIDPELHDPDAAAVLALRLLDDVNTPSLERLALSDAIARTMGDYGAYLSVLASVEPDPEVRAALIDQLRRAAPESARRGIELALTDADATVREAALRSLASQPQLRAELFSEGIVTALGDADPAVRSAAAFAARVRGEEIAIDQLLELARRDEGDARIQALRAIERIDASRLAGLDLVAMSHDGDARVARFAAKQIEARAN